MKKLIVIVVMFILSINIIKAQEVNNDPDFLTDFGSFIGITTLIIPTLIGWINDKLAKPMNKWVTYWVTGLVGIAVCYFSWFFDLGFPPSDAKWWIVLIDAIFIGLASTGIVSIVTSEWLSKLINNKFNKSCK